MAGTSVGWNGASGRVLSTVAALLTALLLGASCATPPPAPDRGAPVPGSGPGPLPTQRDRAWPMHLIDGRYRGANGLGPGDLNGDGFRDYVTNYEFDQRYVVALHPGADGDVRAPWPTLDVWSPPERRAEVGINAESSAIGDLDGDGALDLVGAQGESQIVFWEGNAPGIRILWGPDASAIEPSDLPSGSPEPAGPAPGWTDAGLVPGTPTKGHLHWVTTRDLDRDGLTDIVVGGRVNDAGRPAGIFWLKAPEDPALRRDLTRWGIHDIDPTTESGHGFTFVDLDGDGDEDIADANADFDTPDSTERLTWYENPGPGTAAQRSPWPARTLIQEPIFHTKPQVAAGDLDGDGDADLATQVSDRVILLRNDGPSVDPAEGVRFARIDIAKPPTLSGALSRTIRMADLDGDRRLDLVGFLTHTEASLPQARAAVWWASWTGPAPTATGWTWGTVRWGSGRTMAVPEFGEKWDMADLTDVDGDGDLDIVANCEEWWTEDQGEWWPWFADGVDPQSVGVVWFENTLDESPARTVEQDGVVTIEAERPTASLDGVWVSRGNYRGAADGSGYLQAFNPLPPVMDADLPLADRLSGLLTPSSSPPVRFDVEVVGGTYATWVRRWVPFRWGYVMGGDRSDSAWLSVDGGQPVVLDDTAGPFDTWVWVRVPGTVRLPPGHHELSLRVRERGYAIDRIVLAPPAWSPPR
jgi:hypothetical protein